MENVKGLKQALTKPKATLLAANAAKEYGSPAINIVTPVKAIPRAIPHFLLILELNLPKYSP
jgi:hypothetical protein